MADKKEGTKRVRKELTVEERIGRYKKLIAQTERLLMEAKIELAVKRNPELRKQIEAASQL